jgi:hypothetical protein
MKSMKLDILLTIVLLTRTENRWGYAVKARTVVMLFLIVFVIIVIGN